jgi:hypothetical protein
MAMAVSYYVKGYEVSQMMTFYFRKSIASCSNFPLPISHFPYSFAIRETVSHPSFFIIKFKEDASSGESWILD